MIVFIGNTYEIQHCMDFRVALYGCFLIFMNLHLGTSKMLSGVRSQIIDLTN